MPLDGTISALTFGATFDGVTDDTAALQAWINHISANRLRGSMPAGRAVATTLFLPSHVNIQGADRDATVLQLRDSLNANFLMNLGYTTSLASGGGNRAIRLADFAIDANGPGQNPSGSGYYPLALMNVQDVRLERLAMRRPFGTNLFISEMDLLGSGPGGIPAVPYAQQFNRDVKIRDCIFDGTGQIVANADQNVVCRVDGLDVEGNIFLGGGANQLSLQMNVNFRHRHNKHQRFFRGIFAESCFDGAIFDNDMFEAGMAASVIGDATYSAIWLASANESYTGAGYACSSRIQVRDNRIHDISRQQDGATGLVGIRMSGPYGEVYGASGNRISGNIIQRLTSAGAQRVDYIRTEGYVSKSQIDGNILQGVGNVSQYGIVAGGVAYSTADEMHDLGIMGNHCNNMHVPIWQATTPHRGTLITENNTAGSYYPIAIQNPGQPGYVQANNTA